MHCRWLSVWSANFSFNAPAFQKYFFQRVLGGGGGLYIKLVEILEGWGGGLFLHSKNRSSVEEGGLA